jgi:hypothetical protein
MANTRILRPVRYVRANLCSRTDNLLLLLIGNAFDFKKLSVMRAGTFPYKKNPFLAFDFSHDNYSHRACESNRVEKLWLTEKRVECLEPSNVS